MSLQMMSVTNMNGFIDISYHYITLVYYLYMSSKDVFTNDVGNKYEWFHWYIRMSKNEVGTRGRICLWRASSNIKGGARW